MNDEDELLTRVASCPDCGSTTFRAEIFDIIDISFYCANCGEHMLMKIGYSEFEHMDNERIR